MFPIRLPTAAVGLAFILAACATSTPDPTQAPPPTQAPAQEEPEGRMPSVTVSDQDASDGAVTIEEVVANGPGWIVIHITQDGAPGPVIGQSQVAEGSNSNVEVEIDLEQATEQLFAMLHVDAGTEGEYEFPGDDAPVFVEDVIVNVPFQVDLPASESETAGESAMGSERVLVIDSSYRLEVLEVPVGTTVTWVYDAGLPHTVTSDTNLFNSGTLSEGETFSFTFDEAGIFPYYCRFHGGPEGSGMSGVVNVTEG